jgi:hypothetical protein
MHGSSVLLHWVRGHKGVEGNELADHLANKGAALQAAGPEPFLPFSNALIKMIAREDLRFHWTEKWYRLYRHHRQTRDFFPEPHPAVSKCLLKLNRRDLGLLIRHFTGFSNLMYCQSLIHPGVSPICRLCGEAREESRCIIKTCPALAMTRMACLGQYTITKKDWDINGLLAFFMMPQVARLEEEAQTDPTADTASTARRLHYGLSPGIAPLQSLSLRHGTTYCQGNPTRQPSQARSVS